nr:MAG TPA: hypothetical protein [Caudoviricetes sp.]
MFLKYFIIFVFFVCYLFYACKRYSKYLVRQN